MNDEVAKKYAWRPWRTNAFELFDDEKKILESILIDCNKRIYFFGSSSIPNVGGKGYIDIYISTDTPEKCKELLTNNGYEFKTNAGDNNRLFLQRYDLIDDDLIAYHIHITNFGNENLRKSLAFRDFLIENAELANEYSEIKKDASRAAIQQTDKELAKKVYLTTKQPVIDKINALVEKYIQANPDKYLDL